MSDVVVGPGRDPSHRELLTNLKKRVTVVIVTHNMQQAARISDDCAFLLMGDDRAGELIEFDTTEKIFNNPSIRELWTTPSVASAD